VAPANFSPCTCTTRCRLSLDHSTLGARLDTVCAIRLQTQVPEFGRRVTLQLAGQIAGRRMPEGKALKGVLFSRLKLRAFATQ
jgi:hypothetical protein